MPQENRRSQLSWAFYDWANSAFATTVMAGFFPLFFKQYWSAGTDPTTSTFWLGLGNSGASFLILLMAPLLGAMADSSGRHKRLLALFAGLGIVATAAFFLVDEGAWPWAISIYVIAIIGFSGANVFYDAMLPQLTDRTDFHRLSALGYSLGYLGGGLLFLVNVTMTLKPAWFGLADAAAAVRFSFLSVAVWWLVFSLPLLLGSVNRHPHPDNACRWATSSASCSAPCVTCASSAICGCSCGLLAVHRRRGHHHPHGSRLRHCHRPAGQQSHRGSASGPVHRLSSHPAVRSHRSALWCKTRPVDRIMGLCHCHVLRHLHEQFGLEFYLSGRSTGPGAGRRSITQSFPVRPVDSGRSRR